MEKQKRWQLFLIIAVLVLTLYNILPTIFFYSKPLREPVDAGRAERVASEIVKRVDLLGQDAKDWIVSYSELLGARSQSVDFVTTNPGIVEVSFKDDKEASLFKKFLPQAGRLIPFTPSQLQLSPERVGASANQVLVQRNVPFILDPSQSADFFRFTPKLQEDGKITDLYRTVVNDRVAEVAAWIAGKSRNATKIAAVLNNQDDPAINEIAIALAKELVEVDTLYGRNNPITKRYFASFTQTDAADRDQFPKKFSAVLESLNKKIASQKEVLTKAKDSASLDPAQEQQLLILNKDSQSLEAAIAILTKNSQDFLKGKKPLLPSQIQALFQKNSSIEDQTINLDGYDPFISGLVIQWDSGRFLLNLYPEVAKIRSNKAASEEDAYLKEQTNQLLINDVAMLARLSEESFSPDLDTFSANLDTLNDSQSYLVLDLGKLAKMRSDQILDQLLLTWMPRHTDLIRESYPVRDYEAYNLASSQEKKLGLVVYAPAAANTAPIEGFKNGSIYVIAKGMDAIVKKEGSTSGSEDAKLLAQDFNKLQSILQQLGFIGYSGAAFGFPKEFTKDYIFELNDYYGFFLKGTRENFSVKGSQKYAVLDFTDVEQRILTDNRIEDEIQQDLLKWKEAYQAAQVDLNVTSRYLVPEPTKNVYLENLKLSMKKYFAGDERKVLKWGLDLSGGKTVRIALYDQNNQQVTNPEDLNQAVNELYVRINKMGVAERRIRIENANILLDFPGSQNLSASELVKASAMYFHIVNEKFGSQNAQLAPAVSQFLQEVWNEAVVTNRKDSENINLIAWNHLGGDLDMPGVFNPRSEHAKILYNNGLRLAGPKDRAMSSLFDDRLSSVAIFRADEQGEWDRQTHPLLFVFHNYALEGSSLENIHAAYDSSQGNVLTFGVKNSYENKQDRSGSPREDFYAWTSQFAEDKIVGTPKEEYSRGRGWRMAVILNGSVITHPTLNAALREGGTISGRFSQREVNQLAADLKAGSLSFTPRILSEENVSPELGMEERTKGIVASVVAIALVVASMVGYYHFAGLVASCAVLLNIFIMWGVLQNLGAALTLPGIAGIVLTIGMAVDANVLVFERIREEFKISGKIASAIQAGYKKAFTAIIDSNITTIIAALILIQFDSGPIKGFAVTLIIGIISSMFTALFMTRYFFAGWVRKPGHKELTMAQFLKNTNFDFLGQARNAILITIAVVLAGTYFFVQERKTMFGMDFTGGYSLTVNLEEQPSHPNYRLEAINAFLNKGASSTDFEVRELSRPYQLRIQFGTSMDEKGHPFYLMPEFNPADGKYSFDYQKDPRLDWVVESLLANKLEIKSSELSSLQKNWTIMSGQFSDAMRNNALIGLGAALLCILIYITVRFEFKFAIGAVIGLIHDVVITLGILAFFKWLGFGVQIDLQVIGAIMTIIGYSLNDTIIVFDRIREDTKVLRRMSFRNVINHSLNVTLSRTIMTSGTTLLVLIALVVLGGQSIFAFSLVMTIGVLVGTFSSLFIASPVMLYFHNREEENGSDFASQNH